MEDILNYWQPILLVVNRRINCKCGALAKIVTGIVPDNGDNDNDLEGVETWCQECFMKVQQEQEI
jgi:hypothetical protein